MMRETRFAARPQKFFGQNNISQYLPGPDVLLKKNLEDNITVVINKNYEIIDTDKKPYYLMA